MTLVKWNNKPSLINDINSWFNTITNDFHNNQINFNNNWDPNFDVIKEDGYYILIAELAGLNKKDVNIEIIEDILKISGKRKSNDNIHSPRNIYSQIDYGSFEKSFTLPGDVLENKIFATMENGILKIKIPIVKPVLPKLKKIKIN